MALTESNMMALGTTAPAFELPDTVTKKMVSLDGVKGEQATVIVFSCNHCPYVIHLNHEFVAIANEYRDSGVSFCFISSNNVEKYPLDSPDKMEVVAKVLQYPFPYLYDESQEVAKAYDAACTPDIYVFDQDLKLYYRGRLDGARPGNNLPIDGKDLRHALDEVIMGNPAPEMQIPSAGCNIKWK